MANEVPGLPSRRTVGVAIAFAELAKRDSKASWILYKRKMLAEAVYHFQQAVEKDAKAVGLLLKSVNPTERDLAAGVGHLSILATLLRAPERIEEMQKNLPVLQNEIAKSALRPFRFDELLAPGIAKAMRMDSRSVVEGIALLKAAEREPAKFWSLTLNLDPHHDVTRKSMKMLEEADTKFNEIAEGEVLVRKFQKALLKTFRKFGDYKYSNSPDIIELFLNMERASVELTPLGFLSMWHEMPSRYPPVEVSDYWDPDAYTEDKGLLKLFPELHRHTIRLVTAVVDGADAAARAHEHYIAQGDCCPRQ